MRRLATVLYPTDDMHLSALAVGKVVIAIDVFRATTTITTAIAHGAACVVPVTTPEEAMAVKASRFPSALLGGERNSVLIEGFDLGNSPREYTREVVSGRTIVFTTTNGTRLLRAVEDGLAVLIGALINVDAVCGVALERDSDVLVACAGSHGRVTMEDVLCAGACVGRLRDGFGAVDAASKAALLLWERFGGDASGELGACEHGAGLVDIGLSADLPFATELNRTGVVAELRDGLIVAVAAS